MRVSMIKDSFEDRSSSNSASSAPLPSYASPLQSFQSVE